MKKLANLLMSSVIPALFYYVYILFEDNVLILLSTWPSETKPQTILRLSILSVSCLFLALSVYILNLRDTVKLQQKKIKKYCPEFTKEEIDRMKQSLNM